MPKKPKAQPKRSISPLRANTIGDLRDGAFGAAVNEAFASAYQDLIDRPMVKKPRNITIKLSLTPAEAARILEDVKVEAAVDSKFPAKSTSCTMVAGERELEFARLSPDDPNQLEIADSETGGDVLG